MWCGHAKAVAEAFKEAGYDYIEDQNGEYKDGYFPITISNLYDRRVSAAIGYLDTEHAAPPEPDDLGRDAGRRSCCSRAPAASASRRWSRARRPSSASIDRGEVIVSSGAIHSPAHLLRAGIGPAGR